MANVIPMPLPGPSAAPAPTQEVAAKPAEAPPPDVNLAETLSDAACKAIVNRIDEEVQRADEDRSKLLEIQREGIKRLGVDRLVTTRSEPFDGASVVVHPMMMQAILDFQALAAQELAPDGGPAREERSGEGEEASEASGRFINRLLTRRVTEWRSEHDRMLMRLPIEGSSFKKVWYDAAMGRPRCAYVPCDQITMPYSDTGDPSTVPLFGHLMYLQASEVQANIQSGLWVDHDPLQTASPPASGDNVREETDKITGSEQPYDQREISGQYRYREVQIWGSLPESGDKAPQQWILTYEADSQKLVSLYRNGRPGNPSLRRASFIHYRMFPWNGAYGLGLFHLIGGLSDAAIGSLRALLDGAQLKTLPTGLMLGDNGPNARGGETLRVSPMTWTRINRPGVRDIRELAMPLPYDGPSPVLYELLQFLDKSGKEFASVSLQRLAEVNPNMPVGTTLALVESGARVYSAIHARLLEPTRAELEAYRDCAREMDPAEVQKLAGDGEPLDLSDDTPVYPAATSEAPSATHRIMKAQAGLQLATQAQQVGVQTDLRFAFVTAGKAMGLRDLDRLLPEAEQVNADPFTENSKLIDGANLQLGDADQHQLHIAVHLPVLKIPGLSQGPVGSKMVAHCLKHAGAFAIQIGQAQGPQAAVSMFQQVVDMIAQSIQVPDPTMALVEVEKLKTQNAADNNVAKLQLEEVKAGAKHEEQASKQVADIRLVREELQADLEKTAAETAAKIRLTREANASRERVAAAQITQKAAEPPPEFPAKGKAKPPKKLS